MLKLSVLGARGAMPPFTSPRSSAEQNFGCLLCLPVFILVFLLCPFSTVAALGCALLSTAGFGVACYVLLEIRDYLTDNVPSGRLTLVLRVTNEGDRTDSSAHVRFTGDAYYKRKVELPGLAPGASCIVHYVLAPTGWISSGGQGDRAAIDEMPATLTFTFGADLRAGVETMVPVDFAWFAGGLRKPFRPPLIERIMTALTSRGDADPSRLKVLVFGCANAGKSSFINSVTNMLHDKMQMRTAAGAVGHVDVTLSHNDIPGLPLCMVDTWGLTTDTYKGNELELIMAGRLGDGASMNDVTVQAAMAPVTRQDSDEMARMRAPDAVFVVMPPDVLDNPALLGKFHNGVKKITQMGFMPILLLSKLDQGDAAIRENPSNPSEHQKEKLAEAVNALGVRPDNAFILINYQTPTRRAEIDRNIYRILYHVLVCARDRKEILRTRQKTYQPPTRIPFLSDVSTFVRGRSALELIAGLLLLVLVRAYLNILLTTLVPIGLASFALITIQHSSPSGTPAPTEPTSKISTPPLTREASVTSAASAPSAPSAARSPTTAEADANSSATSVREIMEDVLDGLNASFPDADAPSAPEPHCTESQPPSFESLGCDGSPVALGIPVASTA